MIVKASVEVTGVVDEDAAAVQVAIPNASGAALGITGVASGSSRRRHGDVRDPGIGYKLALARALRKAADDIEAAANRQIEYNNSFTSRYKEAGVQRFVSKPMDGGFYSVPAVVKVDS